MNTFYLYNLRNRMVINPLLNQRHKSVQHNKHYKNLYQSRKTNVNVNARKKVNDGFSMYNITSNMKKIRLLKNKLRERDDIIYLKKPYVLEWIYGDKFFIKGLTKKKEDEWGKSVIGYGTNQWTTKLGESILREILLLLDKNPSRVKVPQFGKNNKRLLPDFETDDGMYENKARTYTTCGTAGEKILGTPLKYCEIPRLYNKPLYIVCMGYQEVEACKTFHLFEPQSEELKGIILDFEEKWNIKYLKATELLNEYVEEHYY
jgi:hypothetical protein